MVDLIPFKKNLLTNHLKIRAKAIREQNELIVQFNINDKDRSILWGDLNKNQTRRDELWKTTCFETFFGASESEKYWELNFSANGNWNLYRFDSYRSPKIPEVEPRVEQIQFLYLQNKDDTMMLEVRLPIQNLKLHGKKLEVSLTSVIEFKDKEKSYYALKHVTDKPDFHQRDSFICNLE